MRPTPQTCPEFAFPFGHMHAGRPGFLAVIATFATPSRARPGRASVPVHMIMLAMTVMKRMLFSTPSDSSCFCCSGCCCSCRRPSGLMQLLEG